MSVVKVTITAIHLTNPQKAKDYAKIKADKLIKYDSRIVSIEVRLIEAQSHRNKNTDYNCEIKIALPGNDLEVRDVASTIEAAIDKAEDKAKRLLVKNKEKHISKEHKKGVLNKIASRFRG